ncbi:MAG TPA: hypothetical protein VK760_15845 [Candidatus Acidoferrales bacterium]|nr:hypothetical protein [Candidatus Acidoferrales bacterium]
MDGVDWLLDSDPAIRWQALRDLADAGDAAVAAARTRVAYEGLGAEILAAQESDGSWRLAGEPVWLTTLFTLLLLRTTGADPADPNVAAAVERLEASLRWDDTGCWDLRAGNPNANAFFEGEVEPCINGGVLALGGYFGRPSDRLAQRLLGEQLDDGGWNCDAPKSARSSFNTTICVLEGLLAYERAVGSAPEIAAARRRAHEYLLDRSLFRRRTTGDVIDPRFLELAFPPRYHYDVLRALEYFRDAGVPKDSRIHEAVRLIESRRRFRDRWLLERAYDESLAVPFNESAGEPSRWNTLRALRVLRRYS